MRDALAFYLATYRHGLPMLAAFPVVLVWAVLGEVVL